MSIRYYAQTYKMVLSEQNLFLLTPKKTLSKFINFEQLSVDITLRRKTLIAHFCQALLLPRRNRKIYSLRRTLWRRAPLITRPRTILMKINAPNGWSLPWLVSIFTSVWKYAIFQRCVYMVNVCFYVRVSKCARECVNPSVTILKAPKIPIYWNTNY